MKKIFAIMVLVWSCSLVMGADVLVPEELIGEDTVAIVDVHFHAVKKDQILASVKELAGDVLPPEASAQCGTHLDQCAAVGFKSLSVVFGMKKGVQSKMIVVGMDEGADSAKVAAFVKSLGPLSEMSPDCPKEVEGCLVWYEKAMPVASPARFEAFEYAYTQLPADQTLSITFIPNTSVLETALAQVQGAEAEMVTALLGGKGICLYTDLGAAAAPKLNLLVLTPTADDATKIQAVANAGIVELKKHVPPALCVGIDSLKAAAAGANVQVSTELSKWAKIVKEMMAGQK